MPADPPRVTDKSVIQKNATTALERRQVFDAACVQWAESDIGKIQRVEPPGGDFYYAKWQHPKAVSPTESP
jgi:hypothetical protein